MTMFNIHAGKHFGVAVSDMPETAATSSTRSADRATSGW